MVDVAETTFETALREQRRAASGRVVETSEDRQSKIELLSKRGGIALADEPERVATRIDRLSRYHPDVRPIDPAALAAEEPAALEAAGFVLERIINSDDFLGVRYLEAGAAAARAVGRVNIRDQRGRLAGYGTGSLVSPTLLLTNHHVLADAEVAASSTVEFSYEDGPDGQPRQSKVFGLEPDRFFLADEALDFALVSVAANAAELAAYGHNRLIASEGKAIVGDFVTIIQHPRGEKKQVALRENRIVYLLERFLHYETDTEPGSSGSPVFNDEWEVVALHHASVPAPDQDELGGIVNEGTRVSRLIDFVRAQPYPPNEQALVNEILAEQSPTATEGVGSQVGARSADGLAPARIPQEALRLSLPLEITVRSAANDGVGSAPSQPPAEAITIDPEYTHRTGYDPDFLGVGPHRVPLPQLSNALLPLAAVNTMATCEPNHALPYHHFSVIMNRERRLAFLTAVNIDGASSFRLRRERDRWFFDPRIPEEEQTGEPVYQDNPLDRGHLVRRLDPAWGPTQATAKISNDDTFHFTNCTPQHEDFNQNQTTWAGLEDYILENADNRDLRVSVFTGPILSADDEPFRGVQLPRQFWKVVAMVKESGGLSATAYLLSQDQLIQGLEFVPEEFAYGAYRTYQVPVRRIEELTGISFGALVDADPLGRPEAALAAQEIEKPEQIQL